MIIIQARLNSKRLPGKVLKKIYGKPMLLYLFESLKKVNETIIVATSKFDHKIINFCKKNKVKCFASNLNNVAKRFFELCNIHEDSYFVRICADSPLIDYRLVNKMLKTFKKEKMIFLSNRFQNFPSGQTIEIVDATYFKKKYKYFKKQSHFEHVTSYFYEKERKKIKFYKTNKDLTNYKMSIDTREDYLKISKLIRINQIKNFNLSFNQLIGRMKNLKI